VGELSPEQAVHERSTVRVTLKNGEKVEVGEPWVHGDSLGGNTQNYGATWAVRLNSVATVEVREVTGKTGATTVGVKSYDCETRSPEADRPGSPGGSGVVVGVWRPTRASTAAAGREGPPRYSYSQESPGPIAFLDLTSESMRSVKSMRSLLQRRDAEPTEDGEYWDKDTYYSWVHAVSIPFPVGSENDDRDESSKPVTS